MRTPELEEMRKALDALDEKLIQQIGERLELCDKIGRYKKAHGMLMMQPDRVEFVRKRAATLGQRHGLAPHFMEALYTFIIEEACRREEEIFATST